MSTYISGFIIPSKMQMFVVPFQLIPAQTWTLVGCFGRGLYRGFCLFATAKAAMTSKVHSSFGLPNDIMEVIVLVRQSPFQTFLFVHISYQLTVSCSTGSPSQALSSCQYGTSGHADTQSPQLDLNLLSCGLIVTLHGWLNDVQDFLSQLGRPSTLWQGQNGTVWVVAFQQAPYCLSTNCYSTMFMWDDNTFDTGSLE